MRVEKTRDLGIAKIALSADERVRYRYAPSHGVLGQLHFRIDEPADRQRCVAAVQDRVGSAHHIERDEIRCDRVRRHRLVKSFPGIVVTVRFRYRRHAHFRKRVAVKIQRLPPWRLLELVEQGNVVGGLADVEQCHLEHGGQLDV